MKKQFSILCIIIFIFISCGDNKVINEKNYTTYGFFDEQENKNPNIQYRLVTGNIVWSIILAETIIAPILLLGFDMYEPIKIKVVKEKGVIIN